MSNHSAVITTKRRRFAPVAIATGVLGAVLLSVSMTGTLSGFVASINNSVNTAASGTLTMSETNAVGPVTCLSTDGGTVSTNTATCATINKFGGSTAMTPGTPVVTNISIKNTGTINASTFTLTPGATCAQSANGAPTGTATDFCAKLNVVITSGAVTVFNGTAATLASGGLININTIAGLTGPVTPATAIPFTFTVTLASTADNTYQGISASLPLKWTFNS